MEKTTLLLIDGTNFFFRVWAGQPLTWEGHDIKCLYSFHLNLCNLLRLFEKDGSKVTPIVCWDGGYTERLKISEEAVMKGLIPMTYKQARREQHGTLETNIGDDFIWQLQRAQEMLAFTRIGQCRIQGEEADDVVSSFCKSNLGKFSRIVLVTTDKDYYQLLWDGVEIYNSSKKIFLTKDHLKQEYGLENADQWVDVGALSGETGDTIFGVPGIGYGTASKLIAKYGTMINLFEKSEDIFRDWIARYGRTEFQKQVFDGTFKTKSTKEAKCLAYKERLEVAWKLKKMHTELPVVLPEVHPNWEKLEEFFQKYRFQISEKNFHTLLKAE